MQARVISTVVMALDKSEHLPAKGETRIMAGGYGVNYAVTVHRVVKVEEGDKYRYVTVRATKRAITAEGGAP